MSVSRFKKCCLGKEEENVIKQLKVLALLDTTVADDNEHRHKMREVMSFPPPLD